MDDLAIDEPRIAVGKNMLIAGLRQTHKVSETERQIPRQWRRLRPYIGSLPHQVGRVAYGVVYDSGTPAKSDYMCAVEVDDFADLPPELDCVRIAQQTYAVFSHSGPVSDLEQVRQTILSEWFPQSGHEAAVAPELDRYCDTYDPASGEGDMELWIPLKDSSP